MKKGLEIVVAGVLVLITVSIMAAMQLLCWVVPEGG